MGMLSIAFGNYGVICSPNDLPNIYNHYCEHAVLVDEFDLDDNEGRLVLWGFSVAQIGRF